MMASNSPVRYYLSVKARAMVLVGFALGCLTVARAQESTESTSFAMGRPIPKLESLPAPVQLAIKKKAGKRHVARVVREKLGDVPAFRVSFREKGRDPVIYVADDGALLSPEEVRPSLVRTLFGTRFEDTPSEVQTAIRHRIGEGKIVKIEKEKRDEAICYRVEFSTARRQAGMLVIADSGEVLAEQRGAISSTRSTASSE
jgi:hypothetical protein